MSKVSVDLKADTSSAVNAPVLTGNTITGPVTIICGSNTAEQQNSTEKRTQEQETLGLKEFLRSHKIYMKENSKRIFEGMKENEADLNEIYTDVFITEGDMKEVNCEREILKIDDAFKNTTKTSQDKHIKCNEIFQSLRDKKKIILTKGVAGIGKTVSVQKFILDWAEGTANQDVDAMFLFPFREMNQIEDKVSFHEFLLEFYPEMKINVIKVTEKCNVAFIFDGLDESRLSLNFKSRKRRSVEERSSVDEMIINLIRGDLLPSSLIWITSRPAAANQIPSKFVGLFTEVRGFTDRQKEEYFRKRIKDKSQADEMIKHIKRSRSLYIMCHIPVFCWITASVLHDILIQNHEENIDTTLTEMYIHFLLIQMNMKNQKYDEEDEEDYTKLLESNKTTILKLAKLAFEQLKKENIIFYEEDLKECDIDVSKDSDYTGMIAEIFKKESVLHKTKVFSFIHLSVQEFLAALHVFVCYMTINMKDLEFFITPKQDTMISLHDILENAIDKSTESERGHLDLFLRFLMGLSLESSQKLLKGLLTRTEDTRDSITKTTRYIQQLQDDDIISDEASVNLFYCLLELKDQSLYERIQKYLHPDDSDSVTNLSDSMCTLMIYVLLMSENVLDEFNMNRYKTRYKQRLVPAVRCCRRAILSGCDLTAESCEVVSSALQFSKCPLRELDLSNNDLKDSGVKLISDALNTHNCQLHTLRLSGCNVTEECCVSLSSCLQSSTSLRELDLSNNDLKDSGVKLISDALKTHNCQLHTLRLSLCNVTEECCVSLSSCLQSSSSLRELDLSNNDLKDSGVKLISEALKTHNCQLHTLRLSGCMVTDEGCCSLASALSSQSSHLRELDLSYNHPQHTTLQLLSHTLNDPNYTINVSHGGERRVRAGLHKCVFGDIVSVNEGESVTLHTHLTELQTDDLIVWYFMGVHIARINREVNRDPVYDPDVRFTDRLKMNNQTGDLTITNITSELTGLYQLDITSKESKTETFSVSLSLKVKMVKERDSVSLHIDVTEEQRDEKIHWKIKHNNSPVAEIITENRKISTSFIEERFRDRLKLDDQTGDLIITHMKNEDSGQYEADVTIGHTHTIHKTFSFTDSAGGLSSGAIAGICVGVLLVIAAAVAVVFYRRRRLSRSRMV